MTEWREVRLGDVLELQRGFDITKAQQRDGMVPVVSSSGIGSRHDISKCRAPGVVVGRKGSLGNVFYLEDDYWPHDTTLWVRDFRGNNPRFCYFLLKTLPLADLDAGASNPTLNRNHAHLLRVSVPGPRTQRRIADTLVAFDELIVNNRRRIEILEEAARSLYREWFVNFRFPGHESATFVDSPIGPIPESWPVVRLDSLRSSARNAIASGPFGSKLGRRDYVAEGTPVIRGQNLAVGGGFTFEGFVYVTEEKTKELAANLARPGDVVVTQRGTLGQVGLIPDESPFKQFVLSQSQMKITVDADRAEAQYVYAVLCSDEGCQRLVSRTMTSGVPHINLALFKEFDLALPPVGLQRQFTAATKPLHHLLHHLAASTGALTAARDLFLPKLVTGAIDVDSLGVDDVFGWGELAAGAG